MFDYGLHSKDIRLKIYERAFDKTVSRGPDMSRTLETPAGWLFFHRLAIMGLTEEGMQPFELDGSAVVLQRRALHGFRSVKEEPGEKATPSKVILTAKFYSLSTKKRAPMFKKLDAEFALIIYDAETDRFIAARDPIGIRPLYYGYSESGHIVFASEPKNLVGLCHRVMPFPPGHYYKDGKFTCYCDIAEVEEVCHDDLETVCKNIHDKLVAGIEKRLDADAPLGFLLSGGLDSSLVCSVAAKLLKKPIRTFAIGMSEDAIDLKYAREVADYIHSDHTEVIITKDDVIENLETVIALLGTYDITTIRASMACTSSAKPFTSRPMSACCSPGEISDELFGYKYTDFAPAPLHSKRKPKKRVRELHMYDVPVPTAASPPTRSWKPASRSVTSISSNTSCPSIPR